MADRSLRLFVAIELPDEVKAALGGAIDVLRRGLAGPFKWVQPANMHLTLQFLGDVDANRVEELAEALERELAGVGRFGLRLSGTGTFPEEGRPSVVWAGLGGDLAGLERARVAVEAAMAPLGFAPERRAFQPHLTLARVSGGVAASVLTKLHKRLAGLRYPRDAAFAVESVAVVRSELRRQGPRYTTLAELPLEG